MDYGRHGLSSLEEKNTKRNFTSRVAISRHSIYMFLTDLARNAYLVIKYWEISYIELKESHFILFNYSLGHSILCFIYMKGYAKTDIFHFLWNSKSNEYSKLVDSFKIQPVWSSLFSVNFTSVIQPRGPSRLHDWSGFADSWKNSCTLFSSAELKN